MKKCPYCAEEIQDEAIICRFCGRDVVDIAKGNIGLKKLRGIDVNRQEDVLRIPQYITKTITYGSESEMHAGISEMEELGWEVLSTNTIDRGWDPGNTCCLGLIFLPLALLGKRGNHFQVSFRKRLLSESELRSNLQSSKLIVNDSSDLESLITYSKALKADMNDLGLQTENQAALKILSQLEKIHNDVLEKIKETRIRNIQSKRKKINLDKPFSNKENEITRLITLLNEDIDLLKSAPENSSFDSEIQKNLDNIKELENHLTELITKRVLGSLQGLTSEDILKHDIDVLEKQQQLVQADIKLLSKHKNISTLAKALSNRRKIERKIRKTLRKAKFSKWWKKNFKEKSKLIKIILIGIALILIIGLIISLIIVFQGFKLYYSSESGLSEAENPCLQFESAVSDAGFEYRFTPIYIYIYLSGLTDQNISVNYSWDGGNFSSVNCDLIIEKDTWECIFPSVYKSSNLDIKFTNNECESSLFSLGSNELDWSIWKNCDSDFIESVKDNHTSYTYGLLGDKFTVELPGLNRFENAILGYSWDDEEEIYEATCIESLENEEGLLCELPNNKSKKKLTLFIADGECFWYLKALGQQMIQDSFIEE